MLDMGSMYGLLQDKKAGKNNKYIKAYEPRRSLGRIMRDPRHYQIAILTSLILLGIGKFGFEIAWWHAVGSVSSALLTQFAFDKILARKFDFRSPLISSLSLTMLLRTGSVTLSILAGVLVVVSKYLIRVNGKHVFNPANFAIVIVAVFFSSGWVSPGQWGTAPLLALWLAGLGVLVTTKAKSIDLTLGFLASFAIFVFIRALYLGDPASIPIHQLQNGALLIFAFFMISDPKTTPNARNGRLLYSALVAFLGYVLTFHFYHSAGVIYALILTSPLVPLIDRFFKAPIYQWPTATQTGEKHEKIIRIPA